MDKLFEKSSVLAGQTGTAIHRGVYDTIDWKNRLIGIRGARGIGKTTLLLQRMKQVSAGGKEALYISLDDFYFTTHALVDVVNAFVLKGGRYLFVDEVHKYPQWSRHLKNIYDLHNKLKVVFTGSSVIDIYKQEADISRRALMYDMQGLSFREYLALQKTGTFPIISLKSIIKKPEEIRALFPQDFRPLQYLQDYLKFGYYPFYIESEAAMPLKLQQMLRITMESDLSDIREFDIRNVRKMKQLLYIISANVPYKPNISKLSSQTSIARNIINNYLQYLERARLLNLLYPSGNSTALLQKPEKVFLENTNLMFALADESVNVGSLRETFLLSQLLSVATVNTVAQGDFLVNNKYVFEVGGAGKNNRQIRNIPGSFRVLDNIEVPFDNAIPLWMFGFLY